MIAHKRFSRGKGDALPLSKAAGGEDASSNPVVFNVSRPFRRARLSSLAAAGAAVTTGAIESAIC